MASKTLNQLLSHFQYQYSLDFFVLICRIFLGIIYFVKVLATCGIRKVLDYIFKQEELFWLDDLLPGAAITKIIKTKNKEKTTKKDESLNDNFLKGSSIDNFNEVETQSQTNSNLNEVFEKVLSQPKLSPEENHKDNDQTENIKVKIGNQNKALK